MIRVGVLLAAFIAFAVPANPQDAPPVERTHELSPADSALEAQTRALAAELRCPVCQGLSIQDSPAELAQEMKDLIRERLRAGNTPAEVKAYFVSRYGEWVLLEPPARGFNLTVWLVPALALLGGIAFIFFLVRRWTRESTPSVPPELAEEDRARVQRELERLEAERD